MSKSSDPYADLEQYDELAESMAAMTTEEPDPVIKEEDMESIASSASTEECKRLRAKIQKLEEGPVKKTTPKKPKSPKEQISEILDEYLKYNGAPWFDKDDRPLFIFGVMAYMEKEDISIEKLRDPEVAKLLIQILHPLKVYKTVKGVRVPVYQSYHKKWGPSISTIFDIVGCKDAYEAFKKSL